MTTTVTGTELDAFARSVAGSLRRSWPSACTAASGMPLERPWSTGVTQGWTALGSAGALGALLAAQAVLGEFACPLPLLDSFVASRLLARDRAAVEQIEAGTMRPLVVDEHAVVGGPAGLIARALDAADLATHLLVLARDGRSASLHEIAAVVPTPGLAMPAWSDVRLGAHLATIPEADAETARGLMRLGLAARAMGAAGRSHTLATEHAKVRVQFGRPIGAFQFVQMRAVEGLIDLATYRMLQREAVRAFEAGEDAVLPAEVAVTYAAMRATDVQLAAQHTLAATGYFEEHEAPWLFRRVHADVTRLPEYRLAIGEVADVLLETDRTLTGPVLGDRAEALRSELAAFAADIPIDCSVGGMQRDDVFVYALAERGYLSMSWPPEWGGRDASVTERVVLGEELSYRRAPGSRQRAAADIVGTALLRFGTKQQKERYLPLIAAGRFPFYLGYSEPEAGSDLASLRCRAEPDGDGWVINGVKMWGTGAHDAEWVWLAARTDPDARPAHAGITVFLFSTSTPGWGKQEHRALSGEVSCSTFFDDVRIGPDAVVGEVNDGWRIITAALADERVLMAGLTAGVRRSFDDLLARLRADGALAGPRGSVTRRTLSELAVRMQGARLLVDAGLRAAGGDAADARMYVPMAKIVAGELAEDFGEAALRILSTAGALGSDMFERGLRESIVQVVGGGTGDIQRTILARAMGLPR